jgi:hypothetical protein
MRGHPDDDISGSITGNAIPVSGTPPITKITCFHGLWHLGAEKARADLQRGPERAEVAEA